MDNEQPRQGYYIPPSEIKRLRKRIEELTQKYNELLYAVASKYPDETRHETALRYITEREAGDNELCQAIKGDGDEDN